VRKLLFLAVIMLTLPAGMCTTTRHVPVHCLTKEELAELKAAEPPKVADKLTGNAEQDIKPIAGSAVRLRAWGSGMLGVLGGCVAP
jgi:hypothetical protein